MLMNPARLRIIAWLWIGLAFVAYPVDLLLLRLDQGRVFHHLVCTEA